MPQCRSVIQAGKNVFYRRPCVAIFQPAQLNGPPQTVTESESFRPLRFLRPDSLYNPEDDKDIRLELEVGAVSA